MLFVVVLGGLLASGCANGSGSSGTNSQVLKDHMYSEQPSSYRAHL
jgi:hypothetical protein